MPFCRLVSHPVYRATLPPPLSLTLLLLFQSALISLVLSFFSCGYTIELQPCVTHPFCTNRCTKTWQLIIRSPLRKDRVNPRLSPYLLLSLFPSQCPDLSLLSPSACFFRRRGPSVPNNAVNLSLFNPSGQLALRPLSRQDAGAVSQQSRHQSSSLPSLPFFAASHKLITSDKTETLAAVCMQHNASVSPRFYFCFISPTVLSLFLFLN